MQYGPICGTTSDTITRAAARSAYWGAMPKRRAEMSSDITPKKKDIFSRVRTTLAECQAVESFVIREVI